MSQEKQTVQVLFSDDERLMYVKESMMCMIVGWMEVEETRLESDEEKQKFGESVGLGYAVEFDSDSDDPYLRRILPFNFYSIKTRKHDHRELPIDHPLIRDYVHVGLERQDWKPKADHKGEIDFAQKIVDEYGFDIEIPGFEDPRPAKLAQWLSDHGLTIEGERVLFLEEDGDIAFDLIDVEEAG